MAKFEKEIDANFDDILEKIEQGILKGNISSSLEYLKDIVVLVVIVLA